MCCVLSLITLAVSIIAYLIIRRIKSENNLHSDWWIVIYDHIEFPVEQMGKKSSLSFATSETGYSSGKASSMRSATQMSKGTFSLFSSYGLFGPVQVGIYKGLKIAFKPLDINKITINRQLLVELDMVFLLSVVNYRTYKDLI